MASETLNVHLSNDTSISSSESPSTDQSSSFTPFNSNVNQIVRGYPCVKKSNQLYCGSPGQIYPRKNIETYIEENKALIKRMFGENLSQLFDGQIDDHLNLDNQADKKSKIRVPRSSYEEFNDNRIDSCESNVEIVTPYWAANSAGKIRAVVNTQHLQQAIQQEVCRTSQTSRCNKDCTCEQKYKWHRLLAYDPDDDCKGIFMDWFLFPSCCVCRCLKIFKQ